MIRSCAICGSEKRGAEASFSKDEAAGWWVAMHKEGCRLLTMTPSERCDYFLDHGSAVSTVHEEEAAATEDAAGATGETEKP